ncbi:aminopeptidase N [Nocardioides sp. ChNu-153]|uniref:aminopeptidase N n=1 Tax=unclassified Nocardioides TaxID=2615069 RepID=UPI0024051FA5|nr:MULTISPECIES: aminopeptidase N [unclassified Nocardioides]MDF9716347.1 aminopeptidase N [Nocardioides sp. ChNu-99]MDN7122853.1 aminopeptidase N [Nocardioides sp. ChNu-153]
MPGTNLTRDEAATRAALLSVESASVELDLTVGEETFASTTVLRFSSTTPGVTTFADLVGASDLSITLNGGELDPAAVYRDSRIELAGLRETNELRVTARLPYSRTGEGLHRFVDPADGRVYLYSQFEVPDARRVYTTFEQPDLKTVFTFTVRAPEGWKVVSNAVTPEPQPAGDGAATWAFPPTERMSTYITALVAGEYVEVRDTYAGSHGEIDLGLFCRTSVRPYLDADELFELTRQGFAFFEEKFDFPYPFGKYDQLFVPEYNMGAMENAGCVTFRDEYLPRSRQTHAFYEQRANTVLHEMAHMWFGDLVTMKWWDDLWLNESFAEWASHWALVEATRYTEAWTGFTNARKNWAYRQDQLPSTHPIAADNHDLEAVEVNFDGITYAKGASTLKQLVAWVGIDGFLAGLRAYFKAHAFGNSTFADLLAALERESGRELGSWAQEWLQTSGVNTLTPVVTSGEDGTITAFSVRQSAAAEYPTLRRHRLGIGLYDLVDGRLVRRAADDGVGGYVEIDVHGEETEVAALVGARRPDLLLLNDGDLTYAKIRLDEVSLATTVAHVDTIDDTLVRALLWGATWDMTRDAEMAGSDFVELVLRGLATETDMTAVGRLPTYAGTTVAYYTDPSHRPAVKARWEEGLRGLLESAEAGSDRQLAFARAFAGAAHSDAALDLVAALLDGSTTVEGLVVDTDLRWALLTSLAASGRVDEAEIAAELERDSTISGQERAAAARAARPTEEAKAAAWRDAVERDDVANETQRQVAYAFCRSDQADVLAPYLERYLATAEHIWESKGVQRASTVLVGMFPLPLVSPETLARVDEWLASSGANPAAKRYVAEGRSDMARALEAQARDGQAVAAG